MRSLLIAAMLLATLLPMPGAAAKAFMEDASGDASITLFGMGPGVPAPAFQGEPIDLLSLDVAETPEQLTFTLQVTNLKQQVNFAEYAIRFTWAKDEYAVVLQRVLVPGVVDDRTDAFVMNMDDDERWDSLAYLEHEFDLESGTITVHLPKPYILSENGRYPVLGDSLTDLYVEASSHLTFFQFSSSAYDRMPDGDATEKYDFLFGDLAKGHLRVDADERVRVSNGGATTFVYQVVVSNKADIDDDVALTLTDLPEGWNGTVQSPLRIPGGSDRRVAVLMSVPFAHDHGGFSSFNVTATSGRDPASVASVRMGVLHTPIPQPAGHHAELYLHARSFNDGIFSRLFPFTEATMNTDADHTGDAPEATPRGGGDRIRWFIPLDPMLRMGLDFDLDETGEIVGSLVGHGQSSGKVSAELLLLDPQGEDGILLGDTDSVEVTLDLSTPVPFKLTFTPTEEADYVPYLRGQNLALILYYEPEGNLGSVCCLPGATPGLRTEDFKATLPLNEYHDRLTGLSEAGELLSLKAEGAVEKTGLPGATMTYAFTLTNHGAGEEIIDIDVAGTDAPLGTLVPSGSITLGAKESRKITLAVTIPTDRNDGEELEVLVFAHAMDDPSKMAIARTKTIVAKQGSGEALADETALLHAAQAEEANDTPAPGVGVLLALLGVAAFMVRRRAS